jgi:hypothetical protein
VTAARPEAIASSAAQRGEIRVARALRGKARALALEADPQLEHREHVAQRRDGRRIDPSARRRDGSSTKLPIPWRVSIRPLACIREIASRTTVRLTPCAAMTSVSVGSLSPGRSVPFSICAVSASTTSCARLRARRRGAAGSVGTDMRPVPF